MCFLAWVKLAVAWEIESRLQPVVYTPGGLRLPRTPYAEASFLPFHGDHGKRVWIDGCGSGGRHRINDYGHDHGLMRSGVSAPCPRRDTAFQLMCHLLK